MLVGGGLQLDCTTPVVAFGMISEGPSEPVELPYGKPHHLPCPREKEKRTEEEKKQQASLSPSLRWGVSGGKMDGLKGKKEADKGCKDQGKTAKAGLSSALLAAAGDVSGVEEDAYELNRA